MAAAVDARYDAILVDAYRQPYIPFYLSTREFFELCRDRLRPGGMVMVNVGHPEGLGSLEKVLSRTMRDVSPTVVRDPAEDVNTLLIGTAEREASGASSARPCPSLPPGPAPAGARGGGAPGPRR